MPGPHRRPHCREADPPTDATPPALGPRQATGRRRSRVAVLEALLGPQGLLAGGDPGQHQRRCGGPAAVPAATDRPSR